MVMDEPDIKHDCLQSLRDAHGTGGSWDNFSVNKMVLKYDFIYYLHAPEREEIDNLTTTTQRRNERNGRRNKTHTYSTAPQECHIGD
jgi:hypothetical protein